jgi:predicted small lipoprotein YifL
MRSIICLIVCTLALFAVTGCGSKQPNIPQGQAVPIDEEVANISKKVEDPIPSVRHVMVRRLGELGPAAKSAIPAIEKARRKYPDLKQDADEAIAKIQGGS